MYYTYVLRNPEGILYKGSTDNVPRRVNQHNAGDFPGYTKNKGPWECVYKETFKTRKDAETREKYFKTGKGREFLAKVIELYYTAG